MIEERHKKTRRHGEHGEEQISDFEFEISDLDLRFEILNLFEISDLRFRFYCLHSSALHSAEYLPIL